MPWPPRLSRTPLAATAAAFTASSLPLLVAALLLHLAPVASFAISYADGQPEYPSQPEVTSDRNALARFFLQSLVEKEGRARNPHSYAYAEEPDDWTGEALSTKRSNAENPFKFHHQSPLKDIYPHVRFSDDGRAPDGTFDALEEDSALLDKEKILAELLARRLPYHSLHRSSALQSPELTDDGQEDHISRVGVGRQAVNANLLHDLMARYRPPSGTASGAYSLSKRDPFGINARGFHDDVFYRDFGSFNPMKRTARSVGPESEAKESEDQERENKTQAIPLETIGTGEPLALPKTEESYHKRAKRSTEDSTAKPVVEAKAGDEVSSKREERATNETPSAAESSALPASKRRPEMDSSGFHGDTFNNGFGDFWTMKRNHGGHEQEEEGGRFIGKRRPEMDSSGFHGDTFNGGFGDFWTMKRGAGYPGKRRPEMDSSGFHGDTFSSGFGDFYTMKRVPAGTPPSWVAPREGKRRPEMDSSGFHGDTFNGGFGDFWTMKRGSGYPGKRRPEMDSSGFHGDTFNSGFGDFWTMKRNAQARPLAEKRRPEMDSSGFHGDTFHGGFGDFYTMKRDGYPWGAERNGPRESYGKRRPEMDSSGFHGDTFNSGFGDFWTMKRDPSSPAYSRTKRDAGRMEVAKRRPEMDASGFHGDTFSGGFGDFYTLKRSKGEEGARMPMGRMEAKRRPEMDSSGFHGDTFNSGFGDFWTMKRDSSPGPSYFRGVKRRPEMDSSGFHGDTFNSGFGDFWTMKRDRGMSPMFLQQEKRRPEMDSSGFHGDTFNSGFGDFWTMKRSVGSGLGRHEAEDGGSEEADGDLRVSSPGETAEPKAGGEASSRDGQDEEATGGSALAADGKSNNKFDSTKE